MQSGDCIFAPLAFSFLRPTASMGLTHCFNGSELGFLSFSYIIFSLTFCFRLKLAQQDEFVRQKISKYFS